MDVDAMDARPTQVGLGGIGGDYTVNNASPELLSEPVVRGQQFDHAKMLRHVVDTQNRLREHYHAMERCILELPPSALEPEVSRAEEWLKFCKRQSRAGVSESTNNAVDNVTNLGRGFSEQAQRDATGPPSSSSSSSTAAAMSSLLTNRSSLQSASSFQPAPLGASSSSSSASTFRDRIDFLGSPAELP